MQGGLDREIWRKSWGALLLAIIFGHIRFHDDNPPQPTAPQKWDANSPYHPRAPHLYEQPHPADELPFEKLQPESLLRGRKDPLLVRSYLDDSSKSEDIVSADAFFRQCTFRTSQGRVHSTSEIPTLQDDISVSFDAWSRESLANRLHSHVDGLSSAENASTRVDLVIKQGFPWDADPGLKVLPDEQRTRVRFYVQVSGSQYVLLTPPPPAPPTPSPDNSTQPQSLLDQLYNRLMNGWLNQDHAPDAGKNDGEKGPARVEPLSFARAVGRFLAGGVWHSERNESKTAQTEPIVPDIPVSFVLNPGSLLYIPPMWTAVLTPIDDGCSTAIRATRASREDEAWARVIATPYPRLATEDQFFHVVFRVLQGFCRGDTKDSPPLCHPKYLISTALRRLIGTGKKIPPLKDAPAGGTRLWVQYCDPAELAGATFEAALPGSPRDYISVDMIEALREAPKATAHVLVIEWLEGLLVHNSDLNPVRLLMNWSNRYSARHSRTALGRALRFFEEERRRPQSFSPEDEGSAHGTFDSL